jgi:hypothetical protein
MLSDSQFVALERYVSVSRDDDCYVGIGPDAKRKCGREGTQGDEFCTSNPLELCCSATSNVIPPIQPAVPKREDGVNPIFIGAGIIGGGLVFLLILTLIFIRKKVPTQPQVSKSILVEREEEIEESSVLECMFEYKATLLDELDLGKND